MVTPELIEYIKTERARGASADSIRQSLMTQGGWSSADIDEAISRASDTNASRSVVNDPFVLAYRRKRAIIIFIALVVIVTVLNVTSGLNFQGIGALASLIAIGTAIIASRLAVRSAVPQSGPWMEAAMLFGEIVFAAAITLGLGFVFFFAYCVFAGVFLGGFRNL